MCAWELVGVVLVPALQRQVLRGGRVGKFQVGHVPVEQALPQIVSAPFCRNRDKCDL